MTPNPDNAFILQAILGTGAVEQPSTFSTGLAPFNLGASAANQQLQQPQQQVPSVNFGTGGQQQLSPQQQNTFTDTLARFFAGPNSTFGNMQNLHRSPIGSDGLQATHLRIPANQRIYWGANNDQ